MKRVVVTGLGFITSIGNSRPQVLRSLKECLTGIEPFPEFAGPESPVKLAGTVKGFQFPSPYFEDWTYPNEYKLAREQLRPMTPMASVHGATIHSGLLQLRPRPLLGPPAFARARIDHGQL